MAEVKEEVELEAEADPAADVAACGKIVTTTRTIGVTLLEFLFSWFESVVLMSL